MLVSLGGCAWTQIETFILCESHGDIIFVLDYSQWVLEVEKHNPIVITFAPKAFKEFKANKQVKCER